MLAHILEGLFRPRQSLERLLAADPGVGDAALMVVAAYALQRSFDILFGGGAGGLMANLTALAMSIAMTFIMGFLIHVIGGAFGGHATREQALVVAAWHALVMTLLAPILLLGLGDIDVTAPEQTSGGTLLVLAVYAAQWIWLLARYTATVHGFQNDWMVVGVIVGAAVLLAPVLGMFAGA